MFVLPWGEWSYIGTTDTETHETPDDVSASPEDVRYLLRSANALFPNARLQEDDVVASWAALRPLIEDGAAGASAVSREHVILDGPGGMITVAGGKLTTYRLMAAQVVNLVVRHLPPRTPPWPADAGTDVEPLPGGESAELGPIRELGADTKLEADTIEHLLLHYGTEAAGIFNLVRQEPILRERLQEDHPAIAAEVVHAARKEMARSVADVLVRRIHVFYETRDQGATAAPRVAALLARELGWGRDVVEAQIASYRALTGRDAAPATGADVGLALRALPARGGA
jgi:glycerol-3-phosphate dehydrogenase